MAPPLDKMFLLMAIIALPNLYFKAEYNVPLMLFCFAAWSIQYKPLIMYLLLFSWFVDVFRVFNQMSHRGHEEYDKKTLVFVLMIVLFILKIVCIAILMIFDIECRNAVRPYSIFQNLKSTFLEEEKEE